jgi:Protein of unknown function (DUF2569)
MNPPQSLNQPIGVRGWLAFFCFVLIVGNPLLTILTVLQALTVVGALRRFDPDAARTLDSFTSFAGVFSFTLAAFSFIAGILLIRRTRNAVIVAKIYTAAVPTIALLALLAVFGTSASAEVREVMVQGGVQELIKSLGFFAIWFTYLSRSRRVKNTYSPDAYSVAIACSEPGCTAPVSIAGSILGTTSYRCTAGHEFTRNA